MFHGLSCGASQIYEVFAQYNLTYYCTAAHECVISWPSWFTLSAMSALGHVVFIWCYFKKRNEMKWMIIGEIKINKLLGKLEKENKKNKKTQKKN